MNKPIVFYKAFIILILILLIGAGFNPVFGRNFEKEEDVSSLTFYTINKSSTSKCKIELSSDIAEEIYHMFENLKNRITCDPFSDETNKLKNDFVDLLDIYGLIPNDCSKDKIVSVLNPKWLNLVNGISTLTKQNVFPSFGSRLSDFFNPSSFSHFGTAIFCSVAGGGSGLLFPPIMLPRPRFVNFWAAYAGGLTTAANLLTGNGFAAGGAQFGVTLGFMGVGLSFAIPGEPAYFAFGGYSLFTMVGAEEVETYPLNRAPVISEETPSNGQTRVPVSLSELSFKINDPDGDRMNYTVTTEPDIGSDSGYNKKDGRYSVPVSGLDSFTEYSWKVVAGDGEDITEKTFTFKTQDYSPSVYNPIPADGAKNIHVDLTELSFDLKDYQGDLMDFTVETSPNIGAGSQNGVGNGTYSVDVSGLDYTIDYTWFVNVTDGVYWTRKAFNFVTEPKMVFDPFNEGWQYRKMITFNHSMVADDLSDFSVLINIADSDLKNKAQNDGDDILFMDDVGVANRLFHEIEKWDNSSGELISWINIKNISSSTDTSIYMYYGNPSCAGQENPGGTWNSDYEVVYHFNEKSGNALDSTFNYNDGIVTGVTYGSTGIIGDCYSFNGNGRVVTDDFWSPTAYYSMLIWYKPDSLSGDDTITQFQTHTTSNTRTNGWVIRQKVDEATYKIRDDSGNKITYQESNAFTSTSEWKYLGLVRDDTTMKSFLDGIKVDESSNENIGTTSPDRLTIGCYWHDNENKYGDFIKGDIDEFRISRVSLSNEWMKTTFNTMKFAFNGGFFTIGPEESNP